MGMTIIPKRWLLGMSCWKIGYKVMRVRVLSVIVDGYLEGRGKRKQTTAKNPL